jgi:hypothetical protein
VSKSSFPLPVVEKSVAPNLPSSGINSHLYQRPILGLGIVLVGAITVALSVVFFPGVLLWGGIAAGIALSCAGGGQAAWTFLHPQKGTSPGPSADTGSEQKIEETELPKPTDQVPREEPGPAQRPSGEVPPGKSVEGITKTYSKDLSGAREMFTALFGKDWDKYNGERLTKSTTGRAKDQEEIGIDLGESGISACGAPPGTDLKAIDRICWMERPLAMIQFIKDKCSISQKRALDHAFLTTNSGHSVYLRQEGKIGKENSNFHECIEAYKGDGAPVKQLWIFREDFSQMTSGSRCYYLSMCPNRPADGRSEPKIAGSFDELFFSAFSAEMGSNPALIVDLHTKEADLCDDYLTENPSELIDNVANISETEIAISEEHTGLLDDPTTGKLLVQLRQAECNGRPFFHLRIRGWKDNTALPPQVAREVNRRIEEICNERGISRVVTHCNGGLGRAPSLTYYNALELAAEQAKQAGFGLCYEMGMKQQKQLVIGTSVNLACVLRNFLLSWHAIRSTCGQVKEQFMSYEAFAKSLAAS